MALPAQMGAPMTYTAAFQNKSVANDMINCDQLSNTLLKAKGRRYKPAEDLLIQPVQHSPFGDFPNDVMKNVPNKRKAKKLPRAAYADNLGGTGVEKAPKPRGGIQVQTSSSLSKTMGSTRTDYVKKNDGGGSKASSLNQSRPKPLTPPPIKQSTRRVQIAPCEFRKFYERGDLPVCLKHTGSGVKLFWKCKIADLDYHHYLPKYFDGLREKVDPYRYIAIQGSFDMLDQGGAKILPVIPQLIIPIKTALNTRDSSIIAVTLKVLQKLVSSANMIGEALVPYYRQILPIFNLYKNKGVNIGDAIDYGQRKRSNLGELIQETLELFEQTGGEDAFINIKYMIPTYESCVLN